MLHISGILMSVGACSTFVVAADKLLTTMVELEGVNMQVYLKLV